MILIHNATIVDGSGDNPFVGWIRADGERITAVGAADTAPGVVGDRIDATGLVLAPGFVDVHTHDDLQLFADPSTAARPCRG